jgi:hypothetical protein
MESVERAASGLIALGADAEVVEPSELRERLVATVQALVRLYAPTQLTGRPATAQAALNAATSTIRPNAAKDF